MTHASADILTYTVDPTRSSLTVSGTYSGAPLSAQPGIPDSLAADYAGTITADRDFTADTFQMTSATISAQDNNSTALLSIVGSGNYGFSTPSGADVESADFWGILFDFSFSVSSPTISPASGFQMSLLSATISSGQINYTGSSGGTGATRRGGGGDASFLQLSDDLSPGSGLGSLTDAGNVETLMLPIEMDYTTDIGTTPLDLHFSGNIVATASVPEPTSLSIGGALSILLLIRRGRAEKYTSSGVSRDSSV